MWLGGRAQKAGVIILGWLATVQYSSDGLNSGRIFAGGKDGARC